MDKDLSVAIVGGGFGGIGTAIRLRQAGVRDLTVYERADRLGGVWQHNVYPGAACDVPSHLYSYSFAPNPQWTRRFSPGAEIRDYLEDTARRFGVMDAVHTGVDVQRATWDEDAGRWHIVTSEGEREADLLVCACGQLSEPNIPALPGLDTFAGPAFHSARWRADVPLEGARVAVVGTGASAIQLVPAIADRVASLTVYQRSAPWILPKPDRDYASWENRLFEALPARMKAARLANWAFFEASAPAFADRPWMLKPFEKAAAALLRRQVPDPVLRDRLTPRDQLGCKRLLVSNEWYPTFLRPNVELQTDGIERVTDTAIVGRDGVTRETDVIVFSTGFNGNGFVAPMEIFGRDGRRLADDWDPAPQAFLGSAMTGYPNLFLLYGPNTNMGSGTAIYLLESQMAHVAAAVELLQRPYARSLEVRPEAQAAYNAELRERLANSVWESGCSSWYVDEHGHDTSNWPGTMSEFRRRTNHIDLSAYRLEFAGAEAAVA